MKAYRPTTAGIYIIVGAALATALATGNLVRPIKAVAGDPAGPFVQATFVDITPDNLGPYDGQAAANIPDCPAPCQSGLDGGRVHNLAAVPGDATTYFAASEVGGLFKSTNGGNSWSHLDGYLPGTAWDVAAASGGQRVYATAFSEGRRDLTAVLQVSADGGISWRGRLPAAPVTCTTERANQPSAFGIAIRPGTSEVLVGTNCGLARTTDDGDTWTRFDPTPADAAFSVWDAVALPGGRTYACGDDGLLVSASGQPGAWASFARPAATGGFCSLAVSPEEVNVVFAMFANPKSYGELFAADSGALFQGVIAFDANGAATGVTWTQLQNPDDSIGGPKTRLPFVVTNDRSVGYDVWAGIGNVVRGTCATPATLPSPNTPRCTVWSDTYTDKNGSLPQRAHGDSGDMAFDPSVAMDACPTLHSSDGGIYRNARAADPLTCHDPLFVGSNSGLHAFMLWDMEGVSMAGDDAEDLYFGTQDNGLYFTDEAGRTAGTPVWHHRIGGDLYDLAADGTTVAASTFAGEILAGSRGFLNMVTAAPGGSIAASPPLDIPDFLARAGGGRFLLAVTSPTSWAGAPIPIGVRSTTDVINDPFGSELAPWPATAAPPCHIVVGAGAAGPQPYVLAGRCFWPDSGARSAFAGDQLWTYREISPGLSDWVQIAVPAKNPGDPVAPGAGFGLIAVAPGNASLLYASIVRDGDPRMMRSADGGATWTFDQKLTDLMSGNGRFVPYPAFTNDGIFPYLQPLMLAFDPVNPNILVAGGSASGVFISWTGGADWALLTDPSTPGASGVPHLPRPTAAHFDHDKPGTVRVYLGTGRGIWRVEIPIADLKITKADSPDPAFAGETITYTVGIENLGPSSVAATAVKDWLPAEVMFNTDTDACNQDAVGILTCAPGAVAAGAQTSFSIVAGVPADLVYQNGGPKTVTNTAAVSGAIDPVAANDTATTNTLVKAKADVAIVSFAAVGAPTETIVGQPLQLTFHKTLTHHGPSSPVDVSVSRTGSAPPGSSITPTSSSTTAVAVLKDAIRALDESFTITCGAPGPQTFSVANTIALARPADVDPDLSNNTATATATIDCVVPVAINIKPHSFPNAMNLNGAAPVGILTTRAGEYGLPLAFDAAHIVPGTVRFGPPSVVLAETGGSAPTSAHVEDVYELDDRTRDGDLDMVLQFRVADSGLATGSTQACVKGTFVGPGNATFKFFGCDSVKISQ
jgi:uncharacterized repeat protein (TIGR01451 family)